MVASFRALFKQTTDAWSQLWVPLTVIAFGLSILLGVGMFLQLLAQFSLLHWLQGATDRYLQWSVPVSIATFVLYAIVIVSGVLGLCIVTLQGIAHLRTVISRMVRNFIPFLWLQILIIVRSFAWVLLAGMVAMFVPGFRPLGMILYITGCVLALLTAPRLLLAPYLFLRGVAPMDAVRTSYEATKGYWWNIMGNLALLSFIISIPVFVFYGLFTAFSFAILLNIASVGSDLAPAGLQVSQTDVLTGTALLASGGVAFLFLIMQGQSVFLLFLRFLSESILATRAQPPSPFR